MIAPPTLPQKRMAAAYIAALAGDVAAPCTWQVFDDAGKDWRKARTWTDTLRRSGHHLVRANGTGCGIFVAVNECDGKGRKASNVRRIRSLFVDFDGVTPKPSHLPPSMIIQSANGQHWYWLVDDCPVGAFADAQKRLSAYYGSDPVVHDLPRVMRVPGFWHCKREPVMVELVQAPAHCYSLAAVLGDLPALPAPERPAPRQFGPSDKVPGWHRVDAVQAFTDAGYYGRPLSDGKHAVLCPWVQEHSHPDLTGLDGSTVLWETGTQGRAVFRCSHAHCQGRYLVHALAAIGHA